MPFLLAESVLADRVGNDDNRSLRAHHATVWDDIPMNAAPSRLVRYVRSDIRLTATKVFGHSVRIGHGELVRTRHEG